MIRRVRPRTKSDKYYLVRECDQLVSKIVRARDGCCVKCGETRTLQAAHILPKGHYPRLRYLFENILTLCLKCHIFGCHKDPLEFSHWLEEKFPGLEERLRISAATAPKVDLKSLVIVLRDMERKLG